jgi:hypothetical protein
MRFLSIMPLTTRPLMSRPLMTRPFPMLSAVWRLYTVRLIVVLFIMDRPVASLDYALVILLIRINRLLSLENSISPFLLASFCAFLFLLDALGLGYSELDVEVLILLLEVLVLLPEEFHGFYHRSQEFHHLRIVGRSRGACRRRMQWV